MAQHCALSGQGLREVYIRDKQRDFYPDAYLAKFSKEITLWYRFGIDFTMTARRTVVVW